MSGVRLEKNLMSYLRQADATFRNGFESSEMKQIFLKNTIRELTGGEVQLCLQKSFSFILEGMIKEADLDTVMYFYERIKEDWSQIAGSPAGSHVLQSVYQRVIECIHKGELSEINVPDLRKLKDLEMDIDSISSILTGVNSSHAFRSYVQLLGGLYVLPHEKSTDKGTVLQKDFIPKGFLKKLRLICTMLCDLRDEIFVSILRDPHGGLCITCVLEVMSKRHLPKTLRQFTGKIASCWNINNITIFMKDKHLSRVLESVLQYGSSEARQPIKDALFRDKEQFFDVCQHPIANYIVQRFVSTIESEENLSAILKFIGDGLEDILACKNYGIIQKLCEQCLRFTSCQKPFCDELLKAFHCRSAEDRASIVLLISSFRTYDSFFKTGVDTVIESVEYHGSVLLQTLLKFENVGLIVNSMQKIAVENILVILCDSSGSHFIDEFFMSKNVKWKSKYEIVKKIANLIPNIACTKYGSRVLENIWNLSSIEMRRLLAEALQQSSTDLSENEFGKYILRKFQIKRYSQHRDEWESREKQDIKKRKLFSTIVPDSQCPKKKHAV